ncbi:MAG: pentapeptide repeat-containing protein [Nostoc sp.]
MQKDIRGQRFQQDIPGADLSSAIAGQNIVNKVILILLHYFLSFIVSFPTGYIGATSMLGFLTPEYHWNYAYATTALIAWLIAVIFKSYIISLLIAFSSLLILIFSSIIFRKLAPIEITSNFFLESLLAFTVLLSICSINFLFNRLANAVKDILLIKQNWVNRIRIINIFIILIAAIIASSLVVSAAISERFRGSPIREALLMLDSNQLTNAKVIATITACIYSAVLFLSSLWVNQRQGSPWSYPDIIRNWSLTIGSWQGTSFYNLNLSRVNFRGSNLANTDLRRCNLYRTCFQGVIALERARVDNRYLDFEIPKVQQLLVNARSNEQDFSRINLRGAYLQFAELRGINLTETELSGADLQGADLRDSILVNAQVIDVDFTNANLTGICIQDWNVNSKTCFTNVTCDYVYRKLDETGKPSDRYPSDRNFEPREFESLYQEVGNVVELVFKEGLNWRAFGFAIQKLQVEDDNLQLQLKGVEKRGDLWVIKVTYDANITASAVEQRLNASYNELKQLFMAKEHQINKLLGIASSQAEAIKEFSKHRLGNNFFITGSTITNLAGSGQIEYSEAANQVRNIVSNRSEPFQVLSIVQSLLTQLQRQSVATTIEMQAELLKQVLLSEAQKDSYFQELLVRQEQQIIEAFSEGTLATAVQDAIAQLRNK